MRVASVRLATLVLVVIPILGLPRAASAQANELAPPKAITSVRLGGEDLHLAPNLELEAKDELAGQARDVLLAATVLQAAAIDALAVPLVRGETELAWRASLAHSLALGVTLGIGGLFELAGNGAPYSLHTGVAFTSAGFSCAMHLSRRLHDDDAADVSMCAASLVLASATAALDVASSQRPIGDVLAAGAIGLVVGYVAPLALVPERPAAPERPDRDAADEEEEDAPPRTEGGVSWSVAPLLSTPTSELSPGYEERARGGSARAQIGQGATGAGSSGDLGSAIGISISGTF